MSADWPLGPDILDETGASGLAVPVLKRPGMIRRLIT
jgi:hypothetical protein